MEPKQPPPEQISRAALVAIGAIVLALLIVSVYANWQKFRRDRIESVAITRVTPSPTPSLSVAP